MKYNLNTEVNALTDCFKAFNRGIFGNKIPESVITIQRDGGLKCTGYFTPWDSWHSIDETERATEINLTAESLNRPAIDIAETVLHEMIHAVNFMNGVKDTSRKGTFHNSKFRKEAESRGLVCEDSKKYGCVTTGFVDGSKALEIATKWANSVTEKGIFEKYRFQPEKTKVTKARTKSFKYHCPVCETVITAKSERLHIRCLDCEMDFIKED